MLHQEEEALDLSGVNFLNNELFFCLFGLICLISCVDIETEIVLLPGYDMSPFIRRYAKYLGEKSTAYRGTAMDFCKVKRGSVRIFLEKHRERQEILFRKDGGALRIMSGDKLLKTLPLLQNQVDALLEFDCTSTVLSKRDRGKRKRKYLPDL